MPYIYGVISGWDSNQITKNTTVTQLNRDLLKTTTIMKTFKLVFQLILALAMLTALHVMMTDAENALMSATLFLFYATAYVLTIPSTRKSSN